jgi:Baseplate J-like protein
MDNILDTRRADVSDSSTLTGLDYANFVPADSNNPYGSGTLTLYFLNTNVPGEVNIPDLTSQQITLTATNGSSEVPWIIGDIEIPTGEQLQIILQPNPDAEPNPNAILSQSYSVILSTVETNIDLFFNQAIFTVGSGVIASVDCEAATLAAPISDTSGLQIDYLCKDYNSFRQLLLNRLSTIAPNWILNNPADMGVMLVEILAFAGDQLSYYQDAAATEAYLNTARRRISMRRHARLLGYQIQEGCNSRTWVQINYVGQTACVLNPGLQLLTQVNGLPAPLEVGSAEYQQALAAQPIIFETMTPVTLYPYQNNEINFYTWGATTYTLDQGATAATLDGDYSEILSPGDILIFAEILGPSTGLPEDADPTQQWAVCLTEVMLSQDPLYPLDDGQPRPVTQIAWATADALPFCLAISCDGIIGAISVARGNVVLVDQGQTISGPLIPNTVPTTGLYQPTLSQLNLTFAVPLVTPLTSATTVLQQDPHQALPAIQLSSTDPASPVWSAVADLLSSNRFAAQFVVEIETNLQAFLRFGDGTYGKQPIAGTQFSATYRIGNGSSGNIGAQSLYHWVIPADPDQAVILAQVTAINNPLPAQGGLDPESFAQICMNAPQAFRQQNRCVTVQDYVSTALAYPGVAYAAAEFQWMGSWNTISLAIVQTNQQPLDSAFIEELSDYFSELRMMGYDVEIVNPTYVPLLITLVVQVAPGYDANTVQLALQENFGSTNSSTQQSSFNLNNIGFGQTIYLSSLVAEAMTVEGVAGIDLTSPLMQFERYYQPWLPTLQTGMIQLGALEFIQIQNNPNAPEYGQLNFIMEGASS